ncbi:alpha/beta hydrolase [Streptomyces antarcticus]|uniref:alpha/beta hydrolase n=1 Tax=Streptomyces antarcticus TaxID=2996458 RepID=UPI002270B1E6|nr:MULTISPECIES: alpha/beta hydrolase [unclassified Streptomyces]MCY0947536.1 alpha/beta hydrolase [Streptomyces sp. H34-AA3]MCZ4087185.1 alpha/beta hydrolase [Streptomyces sp. H34-S5]
MTLTWQQLRDVKAQEFTEAATAWAEASSRANAARERISAGMVKSLEGQKGASPVAAYDRLKRLDRNFDYIHTECGLIRTTLNSLAHELSEEQVRLKSALEDASARGYTVQADGSVQYPPGGEHFLTKEPLPGASVVGVDKPRFLQDVPVHPMAKPPLTTNANPHHAHAQDIASRVLGALKAAQEVDARFTQALNRLKAPDGLEVTDATWADAAGDAAVVRQEAGDHLRDTIPEQHSPAERNSWWKGLTDEQRAELLSVYPDVIGNLDGIPAEIRDVANRDNLQMLIGKLSEQDDEKSRTQLAGMRSIDGQLWNQKPGDPPMYLLGIGDQGGGRAIVAFGNPDTSRNVSAYVPGLGTALDAEFARNDLRRARDTANGAQLFDESSASIIWLGYDAPQLPAEEVGDNFDVMSKEHAEKGAPAYNQFMAGISATNHNPDPHVTAIGHSYGSLTVGQAAQQSGGIPGADDIILLGSPGTGAQHADQLGVGKEHVYVGASDHDLVSMLPNTAESGAMLGGTGAGAVAGGVAGSVLGPLGTVGGAAIGGIAGGAHGFFVADAVTDASQIYFGTDPAHKDFGANRFKVSDGPVPVFGGDGPMDAHSNYFNPKIDRVSADNIALIVSGHAEDITTQEPR